MTLPHRWEGPEEPIHDRTAGLVVPARTRADYARHPASWLVSTNTTALIGLAAGLACRDDVTTLPAVPGGTARAALGAVRYRHRDPDVPDPGLHPARRLGRAAVFPPDLATSLSPRSMRHAFATLEPGRRGQPAGPPGRRGHASPRTTRRYDRSRGNLDRSPGYLLAGYLGRAR